MTGGTEEKGGSDRHGEEEQLGFSYLIWRRFVWNNNKVNYKVFLFFIFVLSQFSIFFFNFFFRLDKF